MVFNRMHYNKGNCRNETCKPKWKRYLVLARHVQLSLKQNLILDVMQWWIENIERMLKWIGYHTFCLYISHPSYQNKVMHPNNFTSAI